MLLFFTVSKKRFHSGKSLLFARIGLLEFIYTPKDMMMNYGLIIPTLDAANDIPRIAEVLRSQTLPLERTIIIDSSSEDATQEFSRDNGFDVIEIPRSDFNHGKTRQYAVDYLKDSVDILFFMTQDALLSDKHSLENLARAFDDKDVGVAYGRQLPRSSANARERHTRHYNYPKSSYVRSWEDIRTYGIKTAFCSNSFAAYRRKALEDIGGFPATSFGEDTLAVAKMLKKEWKAAYCSDATVIHSHHHSFQQEYRRYHSVGGMHSNESWFVQEFGKPEGEGKRFVASEMKYLLHHNPFLIPSACVCNAIKYFAYRKGMKATAR
jgi:rhamnosyltransferase